MPKKAKPATPIAPAAPPADGTIVTPAVADVARAKQLIDAMLHVSAIVESSDDAIISKTLDGIITSWNKGAERIFGYRADEVLGRNIALLIPPERAPEEIRILQQVGHGERIDHYQTVRRRKDGSLVDISLTVSPIKDASGTIVGASKIARDISEQLRERDLLQRSEELFRVTLSSIGDALIATDQAGRVTFMNAVAETLTGWTRQEAVGMPLSQCFKILNELTGQPVEDPVARVLREGVVVALGNDTMLIARDGRARPIDDSAAPIRSTTGELIGVVLVFRDVTERRAREAEVERLASIVANSSDAIYSVSLAREDLADAIIRTWNRGAELLYGYAAAEIIGKPITTLIPADLQAEDREILVRLGNGELVEPYETRGRTKDGRQVEVSLTASPLRDAKGRIVGVSKIARDITARKRADLALRESEALKTGMLNAGLDAMITINQATEVVEFNAAAERIFGYARAEALGKRVGDLIVPPSLRDAHTKGVARYLSTGEAHVLGRRVELTAMRADGSEFPCEIAVHRVPTEGPTLFTASLRDITQRQQADQALRQSEEQLRTLADNIAQFAWIADETGAIFWYNKRWYDYTGTTLDEMRGWGWKTLQHPEHIDRVVPRFQAALNAGAPWEDVFPLRGKDGEYRWFLSRAQPIRDADGRVVRWLGTNTDITEQHAAADALRHGALHDALTDLPNRAYFVERVSQAQARMRRAAEYRFAVLLLDCDGFKTVNDSLGHAAGDQFLTDVATRLRSCVRPGDGVARLGGDEFTVLLEDVTGVGDIEHAARRIQEAFTAPLTLEGRDIVATASIGAVLGGPEHAEPQDLLRDADLAMYHAKQQGRGRFQLFDVALRDSAKARVDLEADLRSALERHEFRLVFQPIVDLETARVCGVEALLRWDRGKGNVVTPLDFISLAEQAGLILPIGRWVLREVCRYARSWQDIAVAPVRVSVNLFDQHFSHPDVVEDVRAAIQDSGVEPSCLALEIAEPVLTKNVATSKTVLERLRKLGVEVYMDDFGTASSSLTALPLLPLHGIKVDRSLVHRVGGRRIDLDIVRAIVDLAKGLGLRVIGVGIETVAQRERLIAFGCDLAQGHLFAKPLEPTAAGALLTQSAQLDRRTA